MADKTTADALIAKASARKRVPLPAKCRAELAKIIAHNDNVPASQRVSREDALKLLSAHGLQMGKDSLQALMVREFGRKWGGK